MRPLDLYPYYIGNDQITRSIPKALNNFNKIVFILNDSDNVFINNILVMNGLSLSGNNNYTFTIGETGEYNFLDQIQFAASQKVSFLAYKCKAMSTKKIQLDYGNIDNIQGTNKILNLTGAVKCHLLWDTSNDLIINNQLVQQASNPLVIVIPIGDSRTIINDQIDLTGSFNVGYIIERLI